MVNFHNSYPIRSFTDHLSGIIENNGYLSVYGLPVGQGDCTVIKCPNGNIVVMDFGSPGGKGLTHEVSGEP